MNIRGNGDTVTTQIPEAGTKLHKDSVVIAYTQSQEAGGTTVIPNVIGMNRENAETVLKNAGLVMKIDSSGNERITAEHIAVKQSPQADSEVVEGTTVYVRFVHRESD